MGNAPSISTSDNFLFKHRINASELSIQYCLTNNSVADYLTKPLKGSKFRELRASNLNLAPRTYE